MPDPNMVLRLASSYNERGIAGFTHTVTNSEDQRKINVFYEIAENISGNKTLTLSKRPGISNSAGGAGWGATTQNVYLIFTEPTTSTTGMYRRDVPPWVVNSSGGNYIVSSAATDTTIVASGTLTPAYIDKFDVNGTDTVVLQFFDTTANAQRVWFSSTIATWTEITDADFTALKHRGKMESIDGTRYILDAANRIYGSDIDSISSWTGAGGSNFIKKQMEQDVAVGLARYKGILLAFGDSTVEAFYNAGNETGSPLGRIQHLQRHVGLVVPSVNNVTQGHYYCTIGETMFFLGREAGGIRSVGLYAFNGSSFEKVSNVYIDKILHGLVADDNIFSVNAVGFYGKSAVALALTNPNATTQRWLMFFPDVKEWFEWNSTVFGPINSGEHFLPCAATLKDQIYSFNATETWQDADTSYPWSIQFKLPTKTNSIRRMGQFGVVGDTARSAATLTVEFSDDDTVSFQTIGTIDMTKQKKMLSRGGSFRERHVRLGSTDAVAHRLHSFIAHVT